MEKIAFKTTQHKMLADTLTPVSIYLRLRDHFANSILLESSDYHGHENSFSYICCLPIASFKVDGRQLQEALPNGSRTSRTLKKRSEALPALQAFANRFDVQTSPQRFIDHGIFGYMSYDAVQCFEDISFDQEKPDQNHIPEIYYQVFQYVIAIDHFKNELYLFEHLTENATSQLAKVEALIGSKNFPDYSFKVTDKEHSNITDEAYLEMVRKGISHCHRGDVFQIVLSRRYQTSFQGDEFNVYRALRSVNPSPHLFYFDFGSFKIFGSSPEAQIIVKGQKATIHPIAGTFPRTGNDQDDAEIAQKLHNDPKENAEHVMLVDLARNDLSRNGHSVEVEVYKEIQYYSHLIHLVSKVSGMLDEGVSPLRVVGDTFPAGTLSGAPKFRAMELIDHYETTRRSYYGGAIGFLGFNGDFIHAIMIRSFLSKNSSLYYQAGAGVVAKSSPENELKEVGNKLAALRKALSVAENL